MAVRRQVNNPVRSHSLCIWCAVRRWRDGREPEPVAAELAGGAGGLSEPLLAVPGDDLSQHARQAGKGGTVCDEI